MVGIERFKDVEHDVRRVARRWQRAAGHGSDLHRDGLHKGGLHAGGLHDGRLHGGGSDSAVDTRPCCTPVDDGCTIYTRHDNE